MIVAGIEIDESAAVDYVRKEWAAGRAVSAEDIRRKLFQSVPSSPDSYWIQCEAQNRICQRYSKRGVCRYDRARRLWVPA